MTFLQKATAPRCCIGVVTSQSPAKRLNSSVAAAYTALADEVLTSYREKVRA